MRIQTRRGLMLAACVLLFPNLPPTKAADWSQLRGPNGDGSAEGQISTAWPAGGPRRIWSRPIRAGFSSFVLKEKTLCTLVLRDHQGVSFETCLALDAETGAEKWARPLEPAKYTGIGSNGGDAGAPGNRGGDGPRSTPSIDGDRVFVMIAQLKLHCLDLKNGKALWTKDLIHEHRGVPIVYENAASPLIVDGLVLTAGGGAGESILGIDARTGEIAWKGHSEELTHSTPALTTLLGQRQAIFFTRSGLLALHPKSGQKLWHYPFPYRVCAAITPVVGDNLIYCSAGYGIGSGVCEVNRVAGKFSASEVWRVRHNDPVASYWTTPIHHRSHLYGMFGFKKFQTAPLKCVDMKTGAVKWSQPGFGHGALIKVGELLLAMAGHGQLHLVEPSPLAYKELASAKVLTGKCWSTPIFANGRLYARSTTEAVCLDLSPELAGTKNEEAND